MGISPHGERRFEIAFGVLLYALAVGWIWSLSHVRTLHAVDDTPTSVAERAAASIATALTSASAPSAAYLTDATLNALRVP